MAYDVSQEKVNWGTSVCTKSEKQLDIGEVMKFLENINQYPNVSYPPAKPKAGDAYLFVANIQEEQENWKSDQYRWLNYGSKDIPKRDPLVKKLFFVGKNPEGKTNKFQRHVYTLIGDQRVPKPVLVHYIGDETVMVDHPHGNTKKSNDPYYTTAPSVRRSANLSKKSKVNLNDSESHVLNMFSNPVLIPRNKVQVRNIIRNIKKASEKNRPTNEDMATLYRLGTELPGFFHYTRSFPDLVIIVGLCDIASEVENLLKLNAGPLVFSFHETFKVGKFFVTAFNFVHAAFSDRPVIPLAFLVTESVDDYIIFEKFLHCISENISSLELIETAVVTNQEHNFTSSLNSVFPNFVQVYDWELVLMTARSWLRKNNQCVKIITDRAEDLRVLLNSCSHEDFEKNLEKIRKQWDDAFVKYFDEYLLEIIRKRLGRWLLDKYKLYHPQMGVIGARNLDLQVVVRHLQDVKEVTLDILLPSLYHLQVYLSTNVLKGFCGLGKFKLSSELNFLKREQDEIILPSKVYEPQEIVNILKVRGISLVFEEMQEEGDIGSIVQAQRIVEMDNIVHSHQLQAFLVKSPSGSLQAVRLFPRESCSCSLNQRCSHIMAVMLAVGLPLITDLHSKVKSSRKIRMQQSKFLRNDLNASSNLIDYEHVNMLPQPAAIGPSDVEDGMVPVELVYQN
ncbi:uncharacterized protein LOC100203952 [Hydra vulgaris]|uniref:uncharacterized protein LOC100203952 n=1 Tax=Hydra vulgaris TaxID=6087 RepID=UPI000192628D|nr:uncharacterized protein LOC100203952 isoform X1 [Hydra vulgaris]